MSPRHPVSPSPRYRRSAIAWDPRMENPTPFLAGVISQEKVQRFPRSEGAALKEIDYAAPATLTEAAALLARKGARALAGGTDIIVQVRENRRDAELLVDLKNVSELNTLSFDANEGLVLGAAVPCYRIADDPDVRKRYPGLVDAVALIGGVQIQSRASVGGNLCNASP